MHTIDYICTVTRSFCWVAATQSEYLISILRHRPFKYSFLDAGWKHDFLWPRFFAANSGSHSSYEMIECIFNVTRSFFSLTTKKDVIFIFILRSFAGLKANLLYPLFAWRDSTFNLSKYYINHTCSMTRSFRVKITTADLIEYWLLFYCWFGHTLG